MKNILVLGAGRSSGVLIKYLLEKAIQNNWLVTVADASQKLAEEKVGSYTSGKAVSFDINNKDKVNEYVNKADVVISLLPPLFHLNVAYSCLKYSKNLLTASYVSPEIAALHEEAIQKNILILMEMGLDPGIDHLSAKKEIDEIKRKGGKITSFKSYTGGLMAPESDNNPWNYKFTWNPRNVVLAGQGAVKYLQNGKYKFIPYHRLFERLEKIVVPEYGEFEGYANRDSLKYLKDYGLEGVPDFIRGTLRRLGYSSAWNIFVKLGMTDDSYIIPDSANLSSQQFLNSFLKENPNLSTEENLCQELSLTNDSKEIQKIKWLGFFDKEKIEIDNGTPAQILQSILEKKWKLEPGDKDMIVMQHQFEYRLNSKTTRLSSSLVVIGDDEINTAMAKTVGLPLGIAACLLLQGKLNLKGVRIPLSAEVYQPVLEELKNQGVSFINKEEDI